VRSAVAALGVEERFNPGKTVFDQGSMADDFFLLVSGSVAIEVEGKVVREIAATDDDNFFGEISALFPNRPRSATVRAVKAARTLRMRGSDLRAMFEGEMGVRYAIILALKDRGGPTGGA
jgi:CRP-like cAMP-binding protein